MATVYYDDNADLNLLAGKKIAIIGYGSQGHAHAQNLKDSGMDVVVGELKDSKAWQAAENAGMTVMSAAEAAAAGDVIMILVPDEYQSGIYENEIAPGLATGNMLMFAHGFNIHFKQIIPPDFVDVTMVAPKGPGHIVRRMFKDGIGVPGLVAVHQNPSGQAREMALAYAKGIGCTRAGVIETTYKEETETDLFGEQAVLCGGTTALVMAGFNTLVEAGYQPEIAYFECLHELKLIVDLMYEKGITGMRYSISNTAEYGDLMVGPYIIDDSTKERMKKVLERIQNGEFAKEWIAESKAGRPNFDRLRDEGAQSNIEKVGAELRKMMSWIGSEKPLEV